jgi:hypothetical protein
MCGGGGGGGGTIYQPDYDSYDREFELQRDAINQQMSSSVMSMQTQLQGTLRDQERIRTQINEVKVEQAENEDDLQEEAMRLSTLIGAPPPEKSAQAPEIGSRDRGIKTSKGKKSLRIGRTANSSSQGTGLNIT